MRQIILCVLLVSGSLLNAQQRSAFTVGPVTAKAGERASGFLNVPAGIDSATVVPITVIHGSRPGPVLALVAGTHGYEYSPILALNRFPSKLDPKQLSGTLILVHVANMPSYLRRTVYYNPWDGKNLNRVFPGKPDGTVTERIAHAITTEVIERCDYLVDIHCGDGNESLRPYTYWMKLEREPLDEQAKQMALAFGLDHIVIDLERPRDPMNSVFCSNTGATRGKPSITVESGGLGSIEEHWVANIENGITNLMRHLKMLPGAPAYVEHPVWFDRNEVLRSGVTGVFRPTVGRSEFVQKGTLLGVVTDFFGKQIAEFRAPFAGVVLYIVGTPPISPGEPVAFIGRVRQED
jgi:predicted deacylase